MRHRSVTIGQRGAKGQPGGRLTTDGGFPSSVASASLSLASSRGTAPSRPIVYGIRGDEKISSTVPCSTGRPAYMTVTRSAMPATTPRSWVIMITAAPVSCWAFFSTSSTCAWMVTSSAVVGSSAMITSGSLAMAMAIMARWRMPPENSCGKDFTRTAGLGMPTRSSSSIARFSASAREIE